MTQLELIELMQGPGTKLGDMGAPAPNATRAPAPLHALARVRAAVLRFCGERSVAWLTVDDAAGYARMPRDQVGAVLTSPEGERHFARQWDRTKHRMLYRVAVEHFDLCEWAS